MSNSGRNISRRTFGMAAALAGAGALPLAAQASGFPSKPIKLVVPYPPGGQTDALGRALGNHMSKSLGQSFIVDNKPGANTHIGLETVLRDPADGYTVMVGGASSFIMNPLLMKGLNYDAKKDIQLLHVICDMPMMMVVPADHPAKSVKEFIEMAKANPGKLSFGSTGQGGPVQLATEEFTRAAGIQLTHVPYKGSAPATADLLGGRIDVLFDGPTSTLPHVKAGKLRLLGVTSRERVPFFPEGVPIGDTVPGYATTLWFALITRKGLPEDAAKALKAAADKAVSDPALQKQLLDLGNLPRKPMSQTEIDTFLAEEDRRLSKLVKDLKLEPV